MAGVATGERIPGRKYQAIIDAAAQGDSISRISRNIKVQWATAKAVVARESREIADRKQEVLDQSLRIARRAANVIERNITDDSPLNVLVPVYGVALDKVIALSASAQPEEHVHRHLHLHAQAQDLFNSFNRSATVDCSPSQSNGSPPANDTHLIGNGKEPVKEPALDASAPVTTRRRIVKSV